MDDTPHTGRSTPHFRRINWSFGKYRQVFGVSFLLDCGHGVRQVYVSGQDMDHREVGWV